MPHYWMRPVLQLKLWRSALGEREGREGHSALGEREGREGHSALGEREGRDGELCFR